MIYILSGTANQAAECARKHNLRSWEWTYLWSAVRLRGVRQITVWETDTARSRADYAQLADELKHIGAKVVEPEAPDGPEAA